MQSDNYLHLLPEITQRIVSTSHPEKVILFGSYARGDHNLNSDIDLLIIMNHTDSTRAESNRIRRALRGLFVPVDVIVATTEQVNRYRNTIGLIFRTALDEGEVIYDRSRAG